MTGSRAQWYNGMALLFTFFSCRLVWGTYSSIRVYQDVMAALQAPGTFTHVTQNIITSGGGLKENVVEAVMENPEVMRFAGERIVPVWLAVVYLGANITLNTLNFYWFGKMIETVRKRFRPKEKLKVEVDESKGGAQTVTVEKTEVRKRRKA